jgi:hypothetical protein
MDGCFQPSRENLPIFKFPALADRKKLYSLFSIPAPQITCHYFLKSVEYLLTDLSSSRDLCIMLGAQKTLTDPRMKGKMSSLQYDFIHVRWQGVTSLCMEVSMPCL